MPVTFFSFGDHAKFDGDAVAVVIHLKEGIQHTISIAKTLVSAGRVVNLTGLDRAVGLLCAKALDLAPGRGSSINPHLLSLLDNAESLTQAVRNAGPR